MKLIVLDKRYNYHTHFKYCLDFKGIDSTKDFIHLRSRLIESWGLTVEAHLYCSSLLYRRGVNYLNMPWSWSQLDDWHYRIYIVDNIAIAELRLRGLIE